MYERRLLITVRKYNRLAEELIACNKKIITLTKQRNCKLENNNIVEFVVNLVFAVAITEAILPQVNMINKFYKKQR